MIDKHEYYDNGCKAKLASTGGPFLLSLPARLQISRLHLDLKNYPMLLQTDNLLSNRVRNKAAKTILKQLLRISANVSKDRLTT